jgi:hypothetical protein
MTDFLKGEVSGFNLTVTELNTRIMMLGFRSGVLGWRCSFVAEGQWWKEEGSAQHAAGCKQANPVHCKYPAPSIDGSCFRLSN